MCRFYLEIYDTKLPRRSELYFINVIAEITDSESGYVFRVPYDSIIV